MDKELNAPETPDLVRAWSASLPDWLEVSRYVVRGDPELSHLHAGERDAISLALHVKTDAVIIDERRGREEAEKRGLKVIGTLGVLATAHERGLVDLIAAIDLLRQTTFHVSPKLLVDILSKYQSK